MFLHCFKLRQSYSISFLTNWRQNFLGLNPKRTVSKFRKRKEKFCVVLTYFVKWVYEIGKFHIAAMQWWLRNKQKKWCRVAELLFCRYKPIAFSQFSLPLPASLLKLPIVVIQKFCYHGNMTSHFASLLYLQLQFFVIITASTHLHVICRQFI